MVVRHNWACRCLSRLKKPNLTQEVSPQVTRVTASVHFHIVPQLPAEGEKIDFTRQSFLNPTSTGKSLPCPCRDVRNGVDVLS